MERKEEVKKMKNDLVGGRFEIKMGIIYNALRDYLWQFKKTRNNLILWGVVLGASCCTFNYVQNRVLDREIAEIGKEEVMERYDINRDGKLSTLEKMNSDIKGWLNKG